MWNFLVSKSLKTIYKYLKEALNSASVIKTFLLSPGHSAGNLMKTNFQQVFQTQIEDFEICSYNCAVFDRCLFQYNGDSRPNVESLFRPICFLDALELTEKQINTKRILGFSGLNAYCWDGLDMLTSLFIMTTSLPIFAFLSIIQFLQQTPPSWYPSTSLDWKILVEIYV